MDRWLVSRRDLIVEILADPERFTTNHPRSPIRDTFGAQMLSLDGPEHREHRSPFAPPFRPAALRVRMQDSVRRRALDLVTKVEPGDDLSGPASTMAVETVLDILGISGIAPVDTIIEWYDDLAAALANVLADETVAATGRRAAETFRATLHNFGSANAPSAFPGPKLEEAGANNALVILFGGIETTQSALLNAVWALALDQDAQRAVREDRHLLPAAVEESLRWEPAVMTLTRFTTSDVELEGERIPADSGVECLIAGANRDPAAFVDPDRFDIHRANAGSHLTFGYGRHHCLGAHLARLETVEFIGALLDKTPSGFGFSESDPPPPSGHEFRRPPRLSLSW
jgi:cytochrome P450